MIVVPYKHDGTKNKAIHPSSIGFIWGTTWHKTNHPVPMDSHVVVCPRYIPIPMPEGWDAGCFQADIRSKRFNQDLEITEYYIESTAKQWFWVRQDEIGLMAQL